MFRKLRNFIKDIPFIGQILYKTYLYLFYNEGEVLRIEEGLLKGMQVKRFMRTTVPEYISGDYEESLQNALSSVLKDGHTFFDVGAHNGFFDLLAFKMVGENGKIIALEAHPENAKNIESQIKLNSIQNCRVLNLAVTDHSGHINITNEGPSNMIKIADLSENYNNSNILISKQITVATKKLDSIADEFGYPDVIKMDIEGAELLALRGSHQILSNKKPTWLMEIHSKSLTKEVNELLRDYGYKIFDLNGKEIIDNSYVHFIVAR